MPGPGDRSVPPRQQELFQQIDGAFQQYMSDCSEYLDRGMRGLRRESIAQLHTEIARKAEPLVALSAALNRLQEGEHSAMIAGSQARLGTVLNRFQHTLLLLVGLAVGIAGLVRQAFITPLRRQLDQAEEAFDRQEKLASLGILATGVAHEIRNPLTAIKFRLFSLNNALPSGYSQNEDLFVIKNEINRLERIVSDFLQFARPSDPRPVPVPVQELLQETRELLRPELARRKVGIELDPGEALVVEADKQQVQQVLINLIQNAAESMVSAGTVNLRARQGASRFGRQSRPAVMIEVKDTGKGIPPEIEGRLFDPFFSTKEGGTGLGLPIAARIAEKHGGFIMYSTEGNRGTTFTLVLPKATQDETANSVD
jgi:signal transduction histidine kinase